MQTTPSESDKTKAPTPWPLERLDGESGLPEALSQPGEDADESEMVTELLRQVRRYCADEVNVEALGETGRLPEAVLAGISRLGLFGMTIDPDHGGAGLSMKAVTEVVAALAEHDGSLATTVGLHCGLGLRALNSVAPPALQRAVLPELAEGRRLASFAATEPDAGSDLAAIRATVSPHGDGLRLNGSKAFVTNAGYRSQATVLAAAPELGTSRSGHVLVLVDLNSPGVVVESEWHKMGLRASSTCDVRFDDVELPMSAIVGRIGGGMEHAHEALSWGRTLLSSGCIGTVRASIRQALEHTGQRKQFGRPLVSFELVRGTLARSEARLFAMESIVRLVTELEGRVAGSIRWESSIAKVLCSETAWSVVDDAVQLHGGLGYTEEAALSRRLRDVRVTRIFEGANDVLRLHIASAALVWPRGRLQRPTLAPEGVAHPELAPLWQRLQVAWSSTADVILALRKTHGVRLHRKQQIMWTLADLLIHQTVAQAVLLRAGGEIARTSDAQRQIRFVALARLACAEGWDHIDRALTQLNGPEEEGAAATLFDALHPPSGDA